MKYLVIALAVMLASCASTPTEPHTRIIEKHVPVAVPCKVDIGPDPAYPDTDANLKAAPDIFEAAKLYVAGRLMRMHREEELKAAHEGCAKVQ